MDTGREFLETQVSTAEEEVERASVVVRQAMDALRLRKADLTAYQRSLEAYTRDKDNPYRAPVSDDAADAPTEDDADKSGTMVRRREGGRRSPAPLPPRISKRGIIRSVLQSHNGRGMKLGEVYEALPENLPLEVTRDDLYRALPSLVRAGKATRDAHGYYRVVHDADDSQGELLKIDVESEAGM